MPTLNQAKFDAANIAYVTIFNQAFAETEADHSSVAMEVTSSTGQNDYKWLGAVPGMRQWVGERKIKALEAFDYTIKNLDWEDTVGVDRNALEDDNIGVYTPAFDALGAAAKVHPTELVMGLLPDGWANNCYDGVPFFSDNHPVGDGTQSNQTDAVFDAAGTAYEAARAIVLARTNEHGRPLGISPAKLTLHVPPQLESKAKKVLVAQELAGGGTNVNAGSAQIKVHPWLASHPTKWFITVEHMRLKPLILQMRRKATIMALNKADDPNVFFRKQIIWGADARYNAGYGLWQLAYGSTGDA